MYNEVNYNVIICPFPFSDGALHGCTVPGTSGRIADTSDNQSGIFTRAATNSLTGNRVSNSFNGMLLKAGSIGRGESYDKVCESAAKLARYEGNTFHGNGRFGTYTLGEYQSLHVYWISRSSCCLLKYSFGLCAVLRFCERIQLCKAHRSIYIDQWPQLGQVSLFGI